MREPVSGKFCNYCIQTCMEKSDGWRGAEYDEYCLEATESIKGFEFILRAIADAARN